MDGCSGSPILASWLAVLRAVNGRPVWSIASAAASSSQRGVCTASPSVRSTRRSGIAGRFR